MNSSTLSKLTEIREALEADLLGEGADFKAAQAYVNKIKNKNKKAYAQAYLKWAKGGFKGPEPEGSLSVMGRQAVLMSLSDFGIEESMDEEEKMVFGVKREVGGLPRRKFGSGKFRKKLRPTPGSPAAGPSTTAEKKKYLAQKKIRDRGEQQAAQRRKKMRMKTRTAAGKRRGKWRPRAD